MSIKSLIFRRDFHRILPQAGIKGNSKKKKNQENCRRPINFHLETFVKFCQNWEKKLRLASPGLDSFLFLRWTLDNSSRAPAGRRSSSFPSGAWLASASASAVSWAPSACGSRMKGFRKMQRIGLWENIKIWNVTHHWTSTRKYELRTTC